MKPKMPPAKFIKKAPAKSKTTSKSEEKTESKKEKVAEKKDPSIEKAEGHAAEMAKYQAESDARTIEQYAQLRADRQRHSTAKKHIKKKMTEMNKLMAGNGRGE